MTRTKALTHIAKCDDCGEPAVVTYTEDGRTVNKCFDDLGKGKTKDETEALLRKLGLIP
jgi:hypothetical protein